MTQLVSSKPAVRRRSPFGLTTWIPRDLLDFERVFESMFDGNGNSMVDQVTARMDVVETDQACEVVMDLPGVKPEEVELHVENNVLTIRGERKEEREESDERRQFHRIERRFGSFARSVVLPCPVNDAEAAAEFRDGVLKVVLPKTESAKPRKISIK